MPLDEQASAFLRQLQEANGPALSEMSPIEARDALAKLTELRGEPEPVGGISDLAIPGPLGDIPIRVYAPEGRVRSLRWCTFMGAVGWSATWRWWTRCAPC